MSVIKLDQTKEQREKFKKNNNESKHTKAMSKKREKKKPETKRRKKNQPNRKNFIMFIIKIVVVDQCTNQNCEFFLSNQKSPIVVFVYLHHFCFCSKMIFSCFEVQQSQCALMRR